MNQLKKIQSLLKKKKEELQELEAKRLEIDFDIRGVSDAILAYEKAIRTFPKEDIDGDPARSLRAGGQVHRIYTILKEHGKPMHITEILEKLGKDTDTSTQQATGSQLNSYVRQDRIFARDMPNIFGLREWKGSTNNSPINSENAQPALPLADAGEAVTPD